MRLGVVDFDLVLAVAVCFCAGGLVRPGRLARVSGGCGSEDELPFGFHLAESSHRELAEAAGVFDLTAVFHWGKAVFHWGKTGRFDGSLSFLVRRSPCLRSQRAGHPRLRGE